MKKLKFIFSMLALAFMFQPCLMAQDTKSQEETKHQIGFSFSGYANVNNTVADGVFSNATVDYRFTNLIGVQLSSGNTLTDWNGDERTAYTVSAGVCVYPDFKSRFSMIPSLGLGVAGGAIAGIPDKDAHFMVELGVLAKYDLTDNLYCGFDVRSMYCNTFSRDRATIFVAGFRIGCTFNL